MHQINAWKIITFGQFIVLIADETATSVGGCSTDSSVHLIQQIEAAFKVDMFNRQNLAFVVKEKIQTIPLAQLKYAFENGFIDTDTVYFNNLVADKQSLLTQWMVPVKDSWLAGRLALNTAIN